MTSAAYLSLKIFNQKTGATKTVRLPGDTSVHEAIKEVQEKEAGAAGGRDHGLFLPPNKETGKKGVWLEGTKSLRYYGIVSGMTLEYKKKHRPLKIRLRDDTCKTVVIDDSGTVREISDGIGEKIGLKSASEYCLRRPTPPGMSKAPSWLNENQTLHDQDVLEEEELVFAKRLFFSDDNIDKDDPFSLHLLYVESLHAIIEGKYPVTHTDAKDFAAIQMQITYGDHDPNKHKPGFLDVNQFLPLPYRKDKKIQTEIFRDHKKLAGMSDMNAKYRYCQLVRSLKTYGITFFDVKEKYIKGKKPSDKKGDRILIGITKEKIMKVDPETQRTVKEWTFEQMRRWSYAHGLFTLDFGDYEDDYITVLTEEGEAMAQLIASYIDQILKTRVDVDRVVEDDNDEVAEAEMMEGEYGIAQIGMSTSFSHPYGGGAGQSSHLGPGQNIASPVPGKKGFPPGSSDSNPPGHPSQSHVLPPSQRVNVVDMGSAVKCTKLLATELGQANLKFGPPSQLSADEWQKQFNTHKNNLDKTVGDILASAKLSPGAMNRNQLDQKAKQIAIDMKGMAAAARNLVDIDDENIPLLDGTKATAASVADLLELMMKAVDEPNNPTLRPQLDAVEKLLMGSNLLLNDPKLAMYADKGAELLMVECLNGIDTNMDFVLKTIANATHGLPPPIAKTIKDEIEKFKNIEAFTLHSLKDLIPRVLDPTIQRHIAAAGDNLEKQFLDLCGKLTQAGIAAGIQPTLDLGKEALHAALINLHESAKTAEQRGIQGNLDIQTPTRELLHSLASLRTAIDDPQKIVPILKDLMDTQQKVISASKSLAEGADPDVKDRLMNAAKNLHLGVKQLLTDSALLSKNPDDLSLAPKVKADIGRVEGQCQALLADAGNLTALNNLRYNSKVSAAGLIKLASVSTLIGPNVTDRNARAELLASAKGVQGGLAGLLSALQGACGDPKNFSKQSELLAAVNQTIPQASTLNGAAKKAARFVDDPNRKQDLTFAANESSDNLKLLLNAIQEVSILGGENEIDDALAEFDAVKADLETAQIFALQGLLTPVAGQTREGTQELLKLATDTLAKAVDDLSDAAKKGGKLPDPVRAAAAGANQVGIAAKSMATTIADRNVQKKIVAAAKALGDQTINMVSLARTLAADPRNGGKVHALDQGRKQFNVILGELLAEGSGLEAKDINKAIDDIQKEKAKLTKEAPTKMGYKEASDGLQNAGKAINAAISQLVGTARTNPSQLGTLAKVTSATAAQLMLQCSATASAAPDNSTAEAILASARSLADAMSKLLNSARVAASSKTPESMANMAKMQAQVAQNVDDLVGNLGATTSPEVDQSIQRIMSIVNALDSNKLEVSAGKRDDLLNEFLTCAKDLARVTGSLVSSASVSSSKVGLFSKEAANTVKNLVETAKAASLSDGSSVGMSLNGSRIVKGADAIMETPDDTRRVVGIAKKVTQVASQLINDAKEYAKAEPDKDKRAAVVANAQEVVKNATLLANITANANSPQAVQQLVAASKKLKDSTVALENSMNTNQKPGAPSEDSVDPKVAQQLLNTSRTIAVEAAALIRGAGAVSVNQDNAHASEDLKRSTKTLTESIKQLINLTGHLNPGVQECDQTIKVIQAANAEVDKSSIEVSSFGNIQNVQSANLQQSQTTAGVSCKLLADNIKTLGNAVGSSKALVSAAQALQKSIPTLVSQIKTTVASTPDAAQKIKTLTDTKGVLEAFLLAVKAVQTADPNDKQSSQNIGSRLNDASAALGILLGDLQSGAQLQSELDRIINQTNATLQNLSKGSHGSNKPYQESRDDLTTSARELATVMASLLNTDKRNTGQVGLSANRAASTMANLIETTGSCAASTPEQSAKKELLTQAKVTGDNLVKMLGAVKAVANGDDKQVPIMRQAFNDANTGLSGLIAAAKRGAVGEVAMDKAIENINSCIAKLNTQSIFAQAGQLEPDRSSLGQTVQKLQTDLQEASQKLSSIAGTVQRAVRGNEEDLARVASELANAVSQVASASEKTASRIPDSMCQQDVLSSAKSLAIASHQLILAAKDGQRLPNDQSAQHSLNASVKGVAEAATSLMTAVQRSSAEAERGERELEARKQQLTALMKSNIRPVNASAEEVVGAAREVLTSTADLIFANDQGSLIDAGNTAYNTVEKLLSLSAGAARLSSDDNVQKGIKDASIGIGRSMVELLEVAKLNRADDKTMPKLDNASGKVTAATQQLVEALRKLPNAQNVTLDDKGDLDKVAEEELLKCANIIKDAARALEAAKPARKAPKIPGVLDRIDIDTAIVDAAQAIAQATGVLVEHAYGAQRERLEKRKQPGQRYRNDPTWANGLISASHGVADSVQSLVKAANKAATGHADAEELVATARAVAASTAHLVSASRAKSDPNSSSHRQLTEAAKSVANATAILVAAATKAGNLADEAAAEEEVASLSFGGAASKAKEMESQIKILKLEKELEKERMRMLNMRKTKK